MTGWFRLLHSKKVDKAAAEARQASGQAITALIDLDRTRIHADEMLAGMIGETLDTVKEPSSDRTFYPKTDP